MNKKYFYLHIPKTAGTTFNNFLETSFSSKECLFHIESKFDKIVGKRVIGGHIALPRAHKSIVDFDNYIKLTVLREPLAQISSHLRYVKKLGEASEKERLRGHTDPIKKIVFFLSTINFSEPKDITKLIEWLEDEKYTLFHNTQTQYLVGSRFSVSQEQLASAKKAIDQIDYVGITEQLDNYIQLLAFEFKLPSVIKSKKLNITSESYGLDINNPLTIEALAPLICYDEIIYKHAKEKFERDFLKIPVYKIKEQKTYGYLDRIIVRIRNLFLR